MPRRIPVVAAVNQKGNRLAQILLLRRTPRVLPIHLQALLPQKEHNGNDEIAGPHSLPAL